MAERGTVHNNKKLREKKDSRELLEKIIQREFQINNYFLDFNQVELVITKSSFIEINPKKEMKMILKLSGREGKLNSRT